MHESVARALLSIPGWVLAPEVSFSVYGERGVIDILAWHAATRTLLVIELKTEIVDVNEVMGTLDRKRRLAPMIARERGWIPAHVAVWLVVAGSSTNRRRVRSHGTTLRAAFPTRRQTIGSLAAPAGWAACVPVFLVRFCDPRALSPIWRPSSGSGARAAAWLSVDRA